MIPGTTQLGRYRLLRRIGVGGMAEVYEAERAGLGGFSKRVAVKVLLPDARRDPEIVKSFIDEAKIVSGLNHPNVVTVYDFGEIDGVYYLAMEYIDGWDLRELIRRCSERDVRFPIAAAVYVVHELAAALTYIHSHEQEIVHRDATPHNLFVTRDGQVKLGDFGVAKTSSRLARTAENQIKGKLTYLAPEQVSGDPIDSRTDVYVAGLILFELLTGQRFNDGRDEAEIFAQVTNPARRLPSTVVPAAAPLDAVVDSALQEHPAMRTRDAELLAEQLTRYLMRDPCDASMFANFVRLLEEPAFESAATQPYQLSPASGSHAEKIESIPMAAARATRGTLLLSDGDEQPSRAVSTRRRMVTAVAAIAVPALGVFLAVALWPLSRAPSPDRFPPGPTATTVPPSPLDRSASMAEDDIPEPSPARPPVLAAATDAARSLDVESAEATTAPFDAAPDLSSTALGEPRAVESPQPPRRPSAGRKSSVARARDIAPRRAMVPRERPAADTARPEMPPLQSPPQQADEEAIAARRHELAALAEQAKERGLYPGDDRLFDQLLRQGRAAIAQGEGIAQLSAMAEIVDGFRIDPPFIQRKLARLERAIAKPGLDAARRKQLSLDSQRILRLVLAEQRVAASREMSALLSQLE